MGKSNWILKILEKPEEMKQVEDLQRMVWPGSETDVVPLHVLVTVAHNGGVIIGAYAHPEGPEEEKSGTMPVPQGKLIGFVHGFPGLYFTPDGPRPKHCSHELGVHPDYRDQGLGFALKRAQWQMVRRQGLDLITWTFDPLLSRNANLNITKLGAVCNTYLREVYGDMRDGINVGLPSDRFQVDWWVNSQRVNRRLSRRPRLPLDLAHFLSAGAEIINPTHVAGGWPHPMALNLQDLSSFKTKTQAQEAEKETQGKDPKFLLVEIPSDFMGLKSSEPELALEWRMHSRLLFENLFSQGYLVTDFIHLPGSQPRSFYVLSHGESTL